MRKTLWQLAAAAGLLSALTACSQSLESEQQTTNQPQDYRITWQAPSSVALTDLPLANSTASIAGYKLTVNTPNSTEEIALAANETSTTLTFTPEQAKAVTIRLAAIDNQGRLGIAVQGNLLQPSTLSALEDDIIFADDFESHPDWVAGYTNPKNPTARPYGNPAPEGWSIIRTDPARAPSMGDADRHESIEIRTAPEKSHSGVKSAQFYRDAKQEPDWKWWSDGILAKQFEQEYPQIWASFYMKWQPDSLAPHSLSKIFRILHTDVEPGEPGIFRGWHDGHNGPVVIWVNGSNNYGQRNTIAMRGYPQKTNYYFEEGMPQQLPRNMFSGDMSLNWDTNLRDLNRDGIEDNPNLQLYSQADGTLIPGNGHEGMISHADLWGNNQNSQWRRFDFFVKMNSAPGIADGVIEQYVDGQLVFANYTTPWQSASTEEMVGWNAVKIGGNDFISKKLDDALRFEDWYAIDDLVVRTKAPTALGPVSGLRVE